MAQRRCFARDIVLKRQREGIAEAKGAGKCRGCQRTAPAKTDDVLELRAKNFDATEIAREVGISQPPSYAAVVINL